jgi:hypothetical protein
MCTALIGLRQRGDAAINVLRSFYAIRGRLIGVTARDFRHQPNRIGKIVRGRNA